MKRYIVFILLFVVNFLFSQAKKPQIMVVPSDNWCIQHGFVMNVDGNKYPDYKKALQENTELSLVIGKINELMVDRGFPLKSLEQSLKKISSSNAEKSVLASKSGGSVAETPLDELKKEAKADIWIKMNWKLNTTGPKKSVTFQLEGLDAYTDKSIAGASGTGQPSFSAQTAELLAEAVIAHLDNFNAQLQSHFDDMATKGREVTLELNIWDSWGKDFETEFGDRELREIVEDWVAKNAVAGRFSLTKDTETNMLFEEVRMPLYDNSNKALDANNFGRQLRKFLKDSYQIESKVNMRGLGGIQLILGEK